MAGKQRSVFIRFNMTDEADRDLYMKLVEAAGSSVSLTAYVKRVLEEHFSVKIEISVRQEFHEQVLSVFGNAITSWIDSSWHISITRRSSPGAIPP